MPTFDGDNLLITLDSGVTEVDVINDIYEPWKDWMLASPLNRRYPQAFVSDGGNPLSAIINQGSYIFLQNAYGWRIKPPEEDITIYLTGNLAVSDTDLPAFTPTTGAFTAAILGLQPITQGVTETLVNNLEQALFVEGVIIDTVLGVAGTGDVDGVPIGTRAKPSNNTTDAKTIAIARGQKVFRIIGDLSITSGSFTEGFTWIGDQVFNTLTLGASADMTFNIFKNISVTGESDGANTFENCTIYNVTVFRGIMRNCGFFDNPGGTLELSGTATFENCYSLVPGNGYPVINSGIYNITTRNWGGSLGITGMTGGTSTIDIRSGRLILDNSCTGGTISARGIFSGPLEDNSNGTVVNEQFIVSTDLTTMVEKHGGPVNMPTTRTPTSITVNGKTWEQVGDPATSITTTRTA